MQLSNKFFGSFIGFLNSVWFYNIRFVSASESFNSTNTL